MAIQKQILRNSFLRSSSQATVIMIADVKVTFPQKWKWLFIVTMVHVYYPYKASKYFFFCFDCTPSFIQVTWYPKPQIIFIGGLKNIRSSLKVKFLKLSIKWGKLPWMLSQWLATLKNVESGGELKFGDQLGDIIAAPDERQWWLGLQWYLRWVNEEA